jgi:hypothetical protein
MIQASVPVNVARDPDIGSHTGIVGVFESDKIGSIIGAVVDWLKYERKWNKEHGCTFD